ncbi:2-dehydro-3-deoxygluconokinase [Pseudovibrio denitrificans]|uniref:2-dehydro-3-deoxygluconokinase n=2 Tax=Pseudovibrio denitrificans TaxID=258256 RepID=A0A1I7DYQ6_9HYPH|nr:2-dehydro-3-deoxygluconokinase [Pseudovibrio denitrificans]
MLELAPAGNGLFWQSFAGDTFNTAVHLARQFGQDLDVSYITGVGDDPFSQKITAIFEKENIRTDALQYIEGRSLGLYMIENDASGERFFQYWRNASAARLMFDGWTSGEIAKLLVNYDCIYLSGISLAILDTKQRQSLIEALLDVKQDCLIAYDPNYRACLWSDIDISRQINKQLAQLADIALISKEDHIALWGVSSSSSIAATWSSWGTSEVIVKDGGKECLILRDTDELSVSARSNIVPIDTTGAGDAFAAGYVGSRLLKDTILEAANKAHSIAADVIQHQGAIIALANFKEKSEA